MNTTISRIEKEIDLLNAQLARPRHPYDEKTRKAAVGNFHLSRAYGGFALHEITSKGGGCRSHTGGHKKKREVLDLIKEIRLRHPWQKSKLKRTNSNDFKATVFRHLLKTLSKVEENEDKPDRELVDWFQADFERAACHENNLRKIPNRQDRMIYYLQGLPFKIEYTYQEILNLSASWHDVAAFDEKTENKIIENWWNFIAKFSLDLIDNPEKAILLAKTN